MCIYRHQHEQLQYPKLFFLSYCRIFSLRLHNLITDFSSFEIWQKVYRHLLLLLELLLLQLFHKAKLVGCLQAIIFTLKAHCLVMAKQD